MPAAFVTQVRVCHACSKDHIYTGKVPTPAQRVCALGAEWHLSSMLVLARRFTTSAWQQGCSRTDFEGKGFSSGIQVDSLPCLARTESKMLVCSVAIGGVGIPSL
eukprot:1025077-Amphidinium_carterae.1